MLSDLNSTIVRMTSPRFDALLQRGSAEDRLRAMREILAVEKARLVLGNAVLKDIAAKLKENGTLEGYLSSQMGDMTWTASRATGK